MNLRILAPLCLLLAGAAPAQEARAATPSGPEQVALAQRFIDTSLENLPSEEVDSFLALDPSTLPPPLRRPVLAKKLSIRTLMRLSKTEGVTCPRPAPPDAGDPAVLRLAGFWELRHDEVRFLRKQTGFDQVNLVCRSSLLVLPGKNGRRYYLYPADPLWKLVTAQRAQDAEVSKAEAEKPVWRPDGEPSYGEGEGVPASIGMGCGCTGKRLWLNERSRRCFFEERYCRSPWGGDPTEPCRLCP